MQRKRRVITTLLLALILLGSTKALVADQEEFIQLLIGIEPEVSVFLYALHDLERVCKGEWRLVGESLERSRLISAREFIAQSRLSPSIKKEWLGFLKQIEGLLEEKGKTPKQLKQARKKALKRIKSYRKELHLGFAWDI